MTSISLKVGSGILFTGALSGGAYGIYTYNNTADTVKNYLLTNKLTITQANEDAAWTKVYDTYLLEKTSSGLEIKDKVINNKGNIKDWCQSKLTLKIKSKEELLYRQVSKWCVHYKTIQDEVGAGKKIVDDIADLEGEHNNLPEPFKNSIKLITLDNTVRENTNGAKIKKWCEINSKRSYVNNSEFYSKYAGEHCFVNSLG